MSHLTATLFSYYLICSRKSWLHHHDIRMEQESEAVALGKLLDESSYARDNKQLLVEADTPQGVHLVGMIDRANLRKCVLHETKKGKSCEKVHVWQVRFYLWLLKRIGVTQSNGQSFTGQIDYPVLRRNELVMLETEHEQQIERWTLELQEVLQQPKPPPRITQRSFCRKCAFEELCYG